MKHLAVGVLLAGALACGDSKTTEPPPVPVVTKGTVFFALTNCQAYATAEYVVDSTSVGIEPIVVGVVSKGYSVPSGKRMTVARVVKTGAVNGLWTFKDQVSVPENGQVTAHLVC